MIDRQHGNVLFECDTCGEVIDTDERDFEQALALMKRLADAQSRGSVGAFLREMRSGGCMMFSAQDKLDAIKREIGKRQYVYPRLVAEHKLTQAKATREIAVMEAIAEDYEAPAAKERLL